jgi:hypothetical protein
MKVIKKLNKDTTMRVVDEMQMSIYCILDDDEETCQLMENYRNVSDRLSKEDKKEIGYFLLMYANRVKRRMIEKSKGIK